MTPGMKSSEFWFALVAVAVAGLLAWQGVITAELFMQIFAAVSVGFGAARGLAKTEHRTPKSDSTLPEKLVINTKAGDEQ